MPTPCPAGEGKASVQMHHLQRSRASSGVAEIRIDHLCKVLSCKVTHKFATRVSQATREGPMIHRRFPRSWVQEMLRGGGGTCATLPSASPSGFRCSCCRPGPCGVDPRALRGPGSEPPTLTGVQPPSDRPVQRGRAPSPGHLPPAPPGREFVAVTFSVSCPYH